MSVLLKSVFDSGMMGSTGLGALFALAAGMMVFALIIGISVYIYSALALMTIGKKLNHQYPWLAWIPYANFAMVLQLGGFHWAWVFLLLGAFIPILGFLSIIAVMVLGIISFWRIAEKRGFPGWTVLLTLIPVLGGIWALVLIGLLAWKD